MSQHHRDAGWTSAKSAKARERLARTLPAPCPKCGLPVLPDQPWDVGHQLAVSLGGSGDMDNLAAEHRACNRKDGSALGHAKRWGTPTREDKRLPDWLNASVRTGPRPARSKPVEAQGGPKTPVFEDADGTPSMAAHISSLIGPKEYRDTGIQPLHVSQVAGFRHGRDELIRAMGLMRKPDIAPTSFVIADVLNSTNDAGTHTYNRIGVCIPRRAGKSTTLGAVLLGRALTRPGYQVAITGATQGKAKDRLIQDLMVPLELSEPDPSKRAWKTYRSQGTERIEFRNGSRIVVLTPNGAAFRGDAWDAILIDEAQEVSPDVSDALIQAIWPTMLTRPGAQLIIAGTAGEHRSGLLWSTLEDGREGKSRVGIVEYSAGDTLSEDDLADEEVWRRAHPQIDQVGQPVTIDALRESFDVLSLAAWGREFLGVWPAGSTGNFIDMGKWAESQIDGDLPAAPERFSFAIAASPTQATASMVAAWRDADELAHVLVLDHRRGVDWLAESALTYARRFKTAITHDTQSGVTAVQVENLQRERPRPKFEPQVTKDVTVAAALLMQEFNEGRVRHYGQPMLTDAARDTTKRKIGANGWGFGRATPEADITAIEAAALALRSYDGAKPKARLAPTFA